MSTEAQLEALANKLADEALDQVRAVTPPEQLRLMRTELLSDMLVNPAGRRRLRQCLEDPAVQISGERATGATTPSTKKGETG